MAIKVSRDLCRGSLWARWTADGRLIAGFHWGDRVVGGGETACLCVRACEGDRGVLLGFEWLQGVDPSAWGTVADREEAIQKRG